MDVCIEGVLGSPSGTFENDLAVQLNAAPGSAGQLSD